MVIKESIFVLRKYALKFLVVTVHHVGNLYHKQFIYLYVYVCPYVHFICVHKTEGGREKFKKKTNEN